MSDNSDQPIFKFTGFTTGILAGHLGTKGYPKPPEAVVAFKGYLEGPHILPVPHPDDVSETVPHTVFRLYLDDTFGAWIEFDECALKAQTTVEPNGSDARAIVWLGRDAVVTKCEAHSASALSSALDSDPGGGPNVPRHPPY